jgi:hypothetical protein
LKNQISFNDKSGIGFKGKMTKGGRKMAIKLKKQEKEKLSHFMCYQCHEVGHLAKEAQAYHVLQVPY